MVGFCECSGWYILVLLAFLTIQNEQAPGAEAVSEGEVSAALDTTKFLLEKAQAYQKHRSEVWTTMAKGASITDAAAAMKKAKAALNVAQKISSLLTAVSAAGVLADFIFAIFLKPEDPMDAMHKRFDEVNERLNDIMQKMDDMTDELKASDEFNAWLTTYIDYEFTIRNGATKLRRARADMSNAAFDVKERIKIAKEFTDYFTANDIEGKIINVYRLTALQDSSTTRNLFGLLVKAFGCDIMEISRLMTIIQDVMVLGAQQTISYYSLKGFDGRGSSYYKTVLQQMYDIRTRYNEYIWMCHHNAIRYSKDEVRQAITNGRDTSNEELAEDVFNKLAELYPFYAWAVISTDRTEFREEPKGIFVGLQTLFDDAIQSKGSQFYVMSGKYGDEDRKVIVAWQDAGAHITCSVRQSADTTAFYVPCKSCLKDVEKDIPKSDAVLTRKACNDVFFTEPDMSLITDPVITRDASIMAHAKQLINDKMKNWHWIALGPPVSPSACSNHVCNGHGVCQQIPHTSRTLCFCHSMFDGEDCSEYIDPAATEEIIELIADMRDMYADATGIPDVVDVHFAIQDVSDSIQDGLQRVQDSLEYIEQLAKYAEDLQKAAYLSRVYTKLQKGEIDDVTFSSLMDKFLLIESASYILSQVKNALMGNGILDIEGHDFFNSFKRAHVSRYHNPCSAAYVSDVNTMLQNLAGLDLSVSEALMQYIALNQHKLDIQERTSLLNQARKNAATAIERQKAYKQYWSETSCGALSKDNLAQSYCGDMHSFAGMNVQISCLNGKRPSTAQVTCTKSDTKLQWDKDVSCNSYWTTWSQWSACSKSCGGGTRTRSRVLKPDGAQHTETEPCNPQTCCQEKYGKFHCSNGECISHNKLCDARNDCGNYDDENRSRCPNHIRSFDNVKFKSAAFAGSYFDCYGTVNMGMATCQVRKCCPGANMRMRLQNDDTLLAIKNGDRVGIQYGWGQPKGKNKWVSCSSGTSCDVYTSNCADAHVELVFSKCKDDIWTIFSPDSRIGDPIEANNRVFLERYPGHWLSAMEIDQTVKLRTCPGRSIDSGDLRCTNEIWTVVRNT